MGMPTGWPARSSNGSTGSATCLVPEHRFAPALSVRMVNRIVLRSQVHNCPCGPWKTKPFPESFCFVASTEPPALLEKRNHLARESLKPLGVNVHKHVEAVGRTLVDPLLHKVDNLLRGADEPIMSTTAPGDNLTNGDGSVLQQTVSRGPVSG